jgi:hypothetical protein
MILQYNKDIYSLSVSFFDTEDEYVESYSYSVYFSPEATIDYDKDDNPIGFEIIGEEIIAQIKELLT